MTTTSRLRPHYLIVAILLAALASAVWSGAGGALAPAAPGDTEVLADSDGDGVVGPADGQTATLTPATSTLLASRSLVPAGQVATGVLSVTAGALMSPTGPQLIAQQWDNLAGATAAVVQALPVSYYPAGFVGTATATADNTSITTSNLNSSAAITVIGTPVFRFHFVPRVQPLVADPGPVGNPGTDGADRIGNGACGVDCRTQADVIVLVEDANGTNYPNGVQGLLSANRPDIGSFASGAQAFTVSRAAANGMDLDGDGQPETSGVFHFVNGDADGNGANDLQQFVASGAGTGVVVFRLALPAGSGEGDLLVTGPPASLRVEPRTVTGHTLLGAGADTALFGATPPNALGTIDSVIGGLQGNDLVGVRITAVDAADQVVDLVSGAPIVTDTTGGGGAPLSFVNGPTSAGEPAGAWATPGPNASAGAAARGVAWAIGDGGAAVSEGDRTITATFQRTFGPQVTGSGVVRQAGPVTALEVDVEVAASQIITLAANQVGTIIVRATTADGGIAGDSTPITILAPRPLLLAPGTMTERIEVTVFTRNGEATATILPTGRDQIISLVVSADGTSTVAQVGMSAAVSEGAQLDRVEVTADRETLPLGEGTTVRARVLRSDGTPGAGVLGVWRELGAPDAFGDRIVSTGQDGVATTGWTPRQLGQRIVSFTVVTLIDGFTVDTALSGEVRVRVESIGASGLTRTSGFAAWIAEVSSSAERALAALPDASIIWLWTGDDWAFFAYLPDGSPLPGATNFELRRGAVVFIA